MCYQLFLRVMLALLLLCSFTPTTWAVRSINKLWSLVTLTGNYGSFLYNIEPQIRIFEQPNPFQQFLTNASGGYNVTPDWQLWFGQAITTVSQDAIPGSVDEVRTWQQAVWNKQLLHMRFSSRTRVEERRSFGFSDWAFRFRERVLLSIPLTEKIALEAANEILINLKHVQWLTTGTWDQNRASVAIVQQLSESCSISVGYMSQYLFIINNPQADNVLLMNLRFNLPG
jgi:hypothetical protein